MQYFKEDFTLVYEDQFLDPKDRKKLLCVHPHGIICIGWAILFNRPELRGVTFCFSTALYYSPFFRLLTKTLGHPRPVDKRTFLSLMEASETMAIIPGGFKEATISCPQANRVFLHERRGFVKYALQHGYSLTPCYIFHEHELYWNLQGMWRMRHFLNCLGFPAVVPIGRWFCFLLPRNHRLHIVVGRALELPQIDHPTHEEVAEHHSRYVQALVGLFDRHKANYGEAESVLEVW